ncbi:MAG TPA: YoaK family protein [Gaiellaceae bacterium]|nr:YoaK family protein [Gaiellaceae bacterium]
MTRPRDVTRLRQEVVATLRPGSNAPDGPLPPLLLTLTLVTGLVDATSYLKLGHVFVANMTGNVVFLGFGIAGAGGISVWASLVALGSFLIGSVGGGRIGVRWAGNRGRHLAAATATELVLVAAALVVTSFSPHHLGTGSRFPVIALLAIALGVQNAAARRLAVPDLTTTVLTMTLTGVSADSTLAGGPGAKLGRRALAVAAMLIGALVGGVLVLKVDNPAPLAVAAALLAAVALVSYRASRSTPDWTRAPDGRPTATRTRA